MRRLRHLRYALGFGLVLAFSAGWCQAPVPPAPPELPIIYGPELSAPKIDPADRLQGQALLAALRAGGLILYMRHGQSADPRAECPGEPGLTEIGQRQVAYVGAAMRQLGIPVASVRASDTCRARDSAARLGLGQPSTVVALGQTWRRGLPYRFEDRFPYLMEKPPIGSNLLQVAHVQSAGVSQDGIRIELAEVVVYRPQAGGRPLPIARVLPQDWKNLLVEAGAKP